MPDVRYFIVQRDYRWAIKFNDICVHDEEGNWRFKSHRLRPVFMGAEVPLSMAVDLTR